MTRAAACATHASAQRAADRALAEGGSAADAAVAGFFALAGSLPSALFAPTTAIVAGPGTQGRAFDGRAAQPGEGTKRPRGIVDGAPVPLAARAGVPRAPHAVLLLHATFGRRALSKNAADGVAAAKAAVAPLRAKLIGQIGRSGSVALVGAVEPILRAAGQFASGLVTAADLEGARTRDEPTKILEATTATGHDLSVHVEPWASPEKKGRGVRAEVIVAVDARGLMVGLACFTKSGGGDELVVPELEVSLPLVAEPVRRGTTRVSPGVVFAVPPSLAVADGGSDLRAVVASARALDPARAVAAFRKQPLDEALAQLGDAATVAAVIATGRDARPYVARATA